MRHAWRRVEICRCSYRRLWFPRRQKPIITTTHDTVDCKTGHRKDPEYRRRHLLISRLPVYRGCRQNFERIGVSTLDGLSRQAAAGCIQLAVSLWNELSPGLSNTVSPSTLAR